MLYQWKKLLVCISVMVAVGLVILLQQNQVSAMYQGQTSEQIPGSSMSSEVPIPGSVTQPVSSAQPVEQQMGQVSQQQMRQPIPGSQGQTSVQIPGSSMSPAVPVPGSVSQPVSSAQPTQLSQQQMSQPIPGSQGQASAQVPGSSMSPEVPVPGSTGQPSQQLQPQAMSQSQASPSLVVDENEPSLLSSSPAIAKCVSDARVLISQTESAITDQGEELKEHQEAFELFDNRLDTLLKQITAKRGSIGARQEGSPVLSDKLAQVDQKIARLDVLKDTLKKLLASLADNMKTMQEVIAKAKQTYRDMFQQSDEAGALKNLGDIQQQTQALVTQQLSMLTTFFDQWNPASLELGSLIGELEAVLDILDKTTPEKPFEVQSPIAQQAPVTASSSTRPVATQQGVTGQQGAVGSQTAHETPASKSQGQEETKALIKQAILSAIGTVLDGILFIGQKLYNGFKVLYDYTLAPTISRFMYDVQQKAEESSVP